MTALDFPLLDNARMLPCAASPHLFDPADHREPYDMVKARHRRAAQLCQRCPALAGCDQWAAAREPRGDRSAVVAGRMPQIRRVGRPRTDRSVTQ